MEHALTIRVVALSALILTVGCLADVEASGHSAYYLGGSARVLEKLGAAVLNQVTLVHSGAADAAAVCAAIS